jgi:multisubunit Na+/H+ antiporter MnhG subunit
MSRSATLIRVGRDEKGLLKLLIAAQCHRRTQMTTFIIIALLFGIFWAVSSEKGRKSFMAIFAVVVIAASIAAITLTSAPQHQSSTTTENSK